MSKEDASAQQAGFGHADQLLGVMRYLSDRIGCRFTGPLPAEPAGVEAKYQLGI